MAAFNSPFGPGDPNSLPALLRASMAQPGLVGGPLAAPTLTSGFHAPALPGGGMPMQQDPGLANFKAPGGMGMGMNFRPGDPRTAGDRDLGGYSNVAPGGMVDVGGGQMLPNPNGMQYGADGMPIGQVQGGGLSMKDFLTGAWRSITGLGGS